MRHLLSTTSFIHVHDLLRLRIWVYAYAAILAISVSILTIGALMVICNVKVMLSLPLIVILALSLSLFLAFTFSLFEKTNDLIHSIRSKVNEFIETWYGKRDNIEELGKLKNMKEDNKLMKIKEIVEELSRLGIKKMYDLRREIEKLIKIIESIDIDAVNTIVKNLDDLNASYKEFELRLTPSHYIVLAGISCIIYLSLTIYDLIYMSSLSNMLNPYIYILTFIAYTIIISPCIRDIIHRIKSYIGYSESLSTLSNYLHELCNFSKDSKECLKSIKKYLSELEDYITIDIDRINIVKKLKEINQNLSEPCSKLYQKVTT